MCIEIFQSKQISTFYFLLLVSNGDLIGVGEKTPEIKLFCFMEKFPLKAQGAMDLFLLRLTQ